MIKGVTRTKCNFSEEEIMGAFQTVVTHAPQAIPKIEHLRALEMPWESDALLRVTFEIARVLLANKHVDAYDNKTSAARQLASKVNAHIWKNMTI